MFVASSVAWMLLPHHRKEWRPLSNEAAVASALADVPAGQYIVPHGRMDSDWYAAILLRRPRAKMSKSLVLWFLNQLMITCFTGYLVYYALAPEAPYLLVFRIAGTALVLGQIGALFARSIWWGWSWKSVWFEVIEGIVYALLGAGIFGWWWTR
jgi:hypothetical protein